MARSGMPKDISTVDDELPYFAYSATLRISGDIDDFNAISRQLGLNPTHAHRRGDKAGPNSPGYKDDAWLYKAEIPEERLLDEHLQALWTALEPHIPYLLQLKQVLKVDVSCGYRTNHWGAGFEVEPDSLALFMALQIPFGVSIIIA
jgi:hypothetical protein